MNISETYAKINEPIVPPPGLIEKTLAKPRRSTPSPLPPPSSSSPCRRPVRTAA